MVDSIITKIKKLLPHRLRFRLGLIEPFIQRNHHLLKNLFQWGTTDLFYDVEIETTTYCNRKCSYCPNSRFKRSRKENERLIDEKLFHKVIDELSSLDYRGILSPHFYGEPLADARLPELMAYARNKLPHACIEIYTNGELLTIGLYDKLRDVGVDKLNITQHSEKMHKNIRLLFDYRKKSKHRTPAVRYSIFDNDTFLQNRGGLVKPPLAFEIKRCKDKSYCMVIDHLGNVPICCNDYLCKTSFGNVKNESLLEIWNKEGYRKTRAEIRKGIFRLDICKRCTSC